MAHSRRAFLTSTAGAALGFAQPESSDSLDAVPAWIRHAAIPLSTTEPGQGLADLEPLRQAVGNAQIVALGEASHGIREFYRLKHRMLEFLVTRMGFTVFAHEANQPDAQRLNEFVLGGAGDPVKLLDGPLVEWRMQEILDLLAWMRRYNETRGDKPPIEFAGFDMQDPKHALSIVRDFVSEAGSEHTPALDRAVEMVRRLDPRAPDPAIASEWGQTVKRIETLRAHPGAEWAMQNARIVQQCLQYASKLMTPRQAMAIRDAAMAENIQWIAERSKGRKVIVSAHNFHVMNAPLYADSPPGEERSMGAFLRQVYGDKLVTFGAVFHRGSFRARSMQNALREFRAGPLAAGSLDATLAASGIPLFALDMRKAPKSGPVAEWLQKSHPTRNIMSAYYEERPETAVFDQVPGGRYDCLLFVNQASAARSR